MSEHRLHGSRRLDKFLCSRCVVRGQETVEYMEGTRVRGVAVYAAKALDALGLKYATGNAGGCSP